MIALHPLRLHVHAPCPDARLRLTQGGLGIGLALVKHLVELHGGTVQDAPLQLDAGGGSLQVLLVDDNTDAAAMLALILEAAGVAVTGYGQPSDRQATRQAGFDHHFVKPVDSARLIGLVASRA